MEQQHAPTVYDPESANEREVPLPSEPIVSLAPNVQLQPPLTRRGYGPTLVLVLPRVADPEAIGRDTPRPDQIDPSPVQKWAEEGFAVLAYFVSRGEAGEWDLAKVLKDGFSQARKWTDTEDLDVVADKVAMIGEHRPITCRPNAEP
jgi:carboxymethylenebutenolidase